MSDLQETNCKACGSRQLEHNVCLACGEVQDEALLDAGDIKKVSKVEAAAKRRQRDDDNILRSLLATQAGRGWTWRLLSRAHIMHSSFSPDPLVMAMKEGERNIGLSLVADILRVCPENYVLMSNEASTR